MVISDGFVVVVVVVGLFCSSVKYNFMCNISGGWMYIKFFWQSHNYFYGLLAKTFQTECTPVQALTGGMLKQCFAVIDRGRALMSR